MNQVNVVDIAEKRLDKILGKFVDIIIDFVLIIVFKTKEEV